MIETDIQVPTAGTRIAGTRCLPAGPGPFPVVLMIHGSGPLDRDENMPGQRLDIFNAIASALSRVGVASVRYDKRGCGRSGGNYYAAGHEDLVEDAMSVLDTIRGSEWCVPRRVFLLGHSEGCLIAPRVAAQRMVAGLILLCPFVTEVETLLERQAERLVTDVRGLGGWRGWFYRAFLATSPSAHAELIARLKASGTDTIRFRFRKLEAKALRQLLALDIEAIMSTFLSRCSW